MIKARYTGRTSESADLFKIALTLCKRAEKAAENMRTRVRRQAARKILSVYRKAQQKGFKRGQLKAERAACDKLMEIETAYRRIVAEANKDCLELAISIAREVSGKAIIESSNPLVSRINSAIEKLQDLRSIKITINPADFTALEDALERHALSAHITINTSTEISRGNALLETHSGKIALDWQQHLESIAARLHAALDRKIYSEAA